jgi:hypothetical protein
MHHVFATIALGLILLAGPRAPDATAQPADLASVPPDIVDIRLFGEWQQEDRRGLYRGIVTVPEPGKATFTLQWIAVAADGRLTQVDHSLPVPEISELDGIVTDYRSEQEQGGLVIYFDMQTAADTVAETYVLFVDGRQEYTFERASN